MYISRCAKAYKTNISQQTALFTGLVTHGLLSGYSPTNICKWKNYYLAALVIRMKLMLWTTKDSVTNHSLS